MGQKKCFTNRRVYKSLHDRERETIVINEKIAPKQADKPPF